MLIRRVSIPSVMEQELCVQESGGMNSHLLLDVSQMKLGKGSSGSESLHD